jgi:hypothetical protein
MVGLIKRTPNIDSFAIQGECRRGASLFSGACGEAPHAKVGMHHIVDAIPAEG